MKMQRIPFVEWLPDQPDRASGGFEECVNALPADNGYIAGYEWAIAGTSGALASGTSDRVMGMYSLITDANVGLNFVGTKNEIWELKEGGLGQFTATSVNSSYTSSSGFDYWDFTEFGSNIVATNYRNEIQTRDAGDLDGAFIDTAATGGPIQARTITSARNFLIAGNIIDSDGTTPNRIRWSAVNDHTDWVVSATTQADFQDLDASNGEVKRVFGGEYALAFMDRAIYRMNYVGAPQVWQFDEVVSGTGLYFPRSAVQIDNKVFYYAPEGFHVLVNGSEAVPIGHGKVDEWFLARMNDNRGDSHCTAGFDPKRTLVFWTLNGSIDQNYLLVYDYARNKWGLTDSYITADKVLSDYSWFGIAEPGINASGRTISFVTKADDSDVFTLRIAFGQAATVTSLLGSAYVELNPGRNALVTGAIPARSSYTGMATSTTTVNAIGYTGWGDDVGATSTATTTALPGGHAHRLSVRKNGRFHRFQVEWNNAAAGSGDVVSHVDVEYKDSHRR